MVPASDAVTSYRTVSSSELDPFCRQPTSKVGEQGVDNEETHLLLERASHAAFIAAEEYVAFQSLDAAVKELDDCGSECKFWHKNKGEREVQRKRKWRLVSPPLISCVKEKRRET